ncbi:MAG: DegV family protein [Oscillospiraceae bacterium]|nr:DegV family protein [Oscillospiraceae bacterium]
MNKKVIIASDSTCDLNQELLERYQIKILPLGVSLGSSQYKDGVDIDPDAIYAHYEQTGELPKTSAVNIAEFSDFFARQTQDGNAVVLFTISSEMSSTYRNACLAAEEYEDVYVVDTRSLSTGGGLLVAEAGDMAAEGRSAAEIAEYCTAMTEKVSASFVVDDLEFLHKGGRCSAVAALGANLLQLKPCIVVKQGKMGVGKKYRGKFGPVLEKYVSEQLADIENIDRKRIFVTHAGCDSQIIDRCVEVVKKTAEFGEVQVTRAGCTISSHCGRNTLGVLFLRK